MPKLARHFRWEWFLIGTIAVAVLVRILNLSSRELWYDEVLSVFLSTGARNSYKLDNSQSLLLSNYLTAFQIPADSIAPTVINLLRGIASDVHPPLFYLSLHFWRRIFGTNDTAMHGLVALFSVGSILAAYGLGKKILSNRGGLLLAALLGLNPFFLYHSLNLRMYSPLVFWAILSAWALVELIEPHFKPIKSEFSPQFFLKPIPSTLFSLKIFWTLILIIATAAGMLTQYLFAYWVMTLGIFVLIFDRRRWWLHGLRLSMGVILFLPWFFWGTKQQLSNRSDVFRQLSSDKTIAFVDHFQDVASTLASHLLLGDWAIDLPTYIVTEVGSIIIVLLIIATIMLWQKKEHRRLGMALVLGIVPLLLALAIDIAGKKLTVGFGGGRSLIFILPGGLLLITLWIEKIDNKWRSIIAGGLLLFYLSIGVTDFSVRSRWMFHQLTDIIEQESTTPTLIAMNSNAWGHVLRLAYYLPSHLPVNLLAEKSVDLASRLQQNLQEVANVYPRLIWLDLENPVWAKPKTNNEKLKLQTKMQQAIESRYQLITEHYLSGTIDLDNFTARVYQLSTSKSNH
jgi:uncharacterized membrane protein